MTFKKQELPDLPYDYSALEPVISAEIMELHHSKHHAGYVNNFNKLGEQVREAADKGDLETVMKLQSGLKFNGGGHVNHSIFWTNLCPGGSDLSSELKGAIDSEFGSVEKFIDCFNARTGPVQGSGWGWLGYNACKDRVVIETCSNQDALSTKGLIPLLGIDVWEHAYYLQYKNARPAYLKAIWDVVNWTNVSERYAKAKACCKESCSA